MVTGCRGIALDTTFINIQEASKVLSHQVDGHTLQGEGCMFQGHIWLYNPILP